MFQNWFLDFGTITAGSVNQSFKEHNYFWSMRLRKKIFDAIFQIKVEDLSKNVQNIEHSLLDNHKEP